MATPTDLTALGGQGQGGAPTPNISDMPNPGDPGAFSGWTAPATPNPGDPGAFPGYTPGAPTATSTPSWGTQIGNFMQSPTGQVLQAAVPVGVGLYGAQQQAQNIQGLTNQIRAQVTPMAQYGQGVLGQMQGGPQVAGPAGQFVGSQLQGAQALSQAAMPYATGQLTQGQQLALQQAAQGAAARTNLAYSMSGDPLSSANVAAQQAIGNQAIIAAGQIQQQNIQFAQQALGAAQSTYNGLLNQSLASAELGLAGFAPAVSQQIAADQRIGQTTQQLFQQIAQGVVGQNPQGPGGQLGTAAANLFKSVLGGNQASAVNQPNPGDPGAFPGWTPSDMSASTTYTPDTTNPGDPGAYQG
jgi:hypothetical protein